MANIKNKLPTPRPKEGDLILKQEVNYELIVEWHEHSISLNLHLRSHEDHPNIRPDEPIECELYDKPTDASYLNELPPEYKRQFNDTRRILKETYGLTPTEENAVCTACYPHDHTLHFVQFLD